MAAAAHVPGVPHGVREVREPLVAVRHVSKEYDTGGSVVHAMRDVNLVVQYGEFVAIVGASGSGKSTMMNILGCLDRPTRGSYVLAGLEVGDRPSDSRAIVRNRVIGFIFQGFNLLPRTTALENCELPLQYRGVGVRERRRRARAALAAVGLGDRMDHTPNQLSGGQQQRVAIARALVTDPPLLLADEPTGNLDTRTSLEVLALLQKLNRQRGITVVLVTHERDIAACAGRVVTMRDGRIVSDVVQESPLDAAAELSRLPLGDDGAQALRAPAEEADPRRQRMRERIPWRVYASIFFGGRLGVGIVRAVLALAGVAASGPSFFVASQALGLLVEARLGAAAARRGLGHPPTGEQRARIAVFYTVGTGILGCAVLLLCTLLPPGIQLTLDRKLADSSFLGTLLDRASDRGPVFLAFGALVLHIALAFLRYLLLTLLGTKR
jgi:putative ABC transport system ATP-binding protein